MSDNLFMITAAIRSTHNSTVLYACIAVGTVKREGIQEGREQLIIRFIDHNATYDEFKNYFVVLKYESSSLLQSLA